MRLARRYCEEFERLKLQHLQSGGDAAVARAAAGTGPSVMNPYPHITAPLQLSYTAAEGIIYLPSGRGAIAATMTPPFPLEAAQDAAREKQLSDLAEKAAVQSDDEEEGNAVDAEMAVADAMADAAANAVVVGGGHNGLTTAAYLARAGLEVCLCSPSADCDRATGRVR